MGVTGDHDNRELLRLPDGWLNCRICLRFALYSLKLRFVNTRRTRSGGTPAEENRNKRIADLAWRTRGWKAFLIDADGCPCISHGLVRALVSAIASYGETVVLSWMVYVRIRTYQ